MISRWRGRGWQNRPGNACNLGDGRVDNAVFDWVHLDQFENYDQWIPNFVQNVGYTGEQDLSHAEPLTISLIIYE